MKKKIYIAVDSNNNWLTYGTFKDEDECLDVAKAADNFNNPDMVYVFQVSKEKRFTLKN
jgi:hypothetical protein